MKLEDQVLSIEQAKRLQELGLDMNNAVFMWTRIMPEYENENTPQRDKAWSVRRLCYTEPEYPYFDVIPTYTLQEILDKLPKYITFDSEKYVLEISLNHQASVYYVNVKYNDGYIVFKNKELFTALYRMLCWLLENGYLKE